LTHPKQAQESWIDQVVRSTSNLESPERYYWWSAIAAIAAVVRKQVFLDRGGHYKLYPNVYVALLSKHSGLRKGHPVSLISKLINGTQTTRTIEGRSSIQSVISEFSKQVTLENGRVLNEAHGIMVSGEFDTMLLKDPDALTVLTALYNTHEHNGKWRNSLKGSGVEELRNPCISMLVASNETLFEDFVKQKDIEGGFLARTFIVHESKRRTINDLIDPDPEIIPSKTLTEQLKEISKAQGEFRWSDEAKGIYRPWYRELCETQYDDQTGSINRLGDSVLKVAMLINLSNGCDLVIHKRDIELAIEKCTECLPGVKVITRSTGMSEIAPAQRQFISAMLAAKDYTMSRKSVLRKLQGNVDNRSLDLVLETLEQSDCVKAYRGDDRQIWYVLTASAVVMFSKFVEEG